jgi:MPBQ/MSBQ methyltransferase
MLTARTRLADKIQFREGDALSLELPEQTFDVVWSQNVAMNIANRRRLYSEVHRVLKPGGRYVFADVVAGAGGPPYFPVPWASDPSCSFLLTADETRANLEAAGFCIVAFDDLTAAAFEHQTGRTYDAGSPTTLGVHIVLGLDGLSMLKNSARNFEEGRTRLLQGLAVRNG